MRLIIRAWNENQPQLKLARRAAEKSILCLERIARYRTVLSQPFPEIKALPNETLAREMIGSVGAVGDADLTPLAAVAGTIADAVADWLFDQGMPRVIVDNGGDIAVRLADGETATVGIRPTISSPLISHVIELDSGSSNWGVTTSGVGGRSFTRGIASAVTVLAAKASMADAAATAVANACFAEDIGITQLPAERIDPNSDLAGLCVTTEVGNLESDSIRQALENARLKAEAICQKGLIIGTFIALGSKLAITDGLKEYMRPLNGI
jgi:hypothetical protein